MQFNTGLLHQNVLEYFHIYWRRQREAKAQERKKTIVDLKKIIECSVDEL